MSEPKSLYDGPAKIDQMLKLIDEQIERPKETASYVLDNFPKEQLKKIRMFLESFRY